VPIHRHEVTTSDDRRLSAVTAVQTEHGTSKKESRWKMTADGLGSKPVKAQTEHLLSASPRRPDLFGRESKSVTAIVGFTETVGAGKLYNAAAVFHDGRVVGIRFLMTLRKRSIWNIGLLYR
jgi:hypothetical protein